VYDTVVPFRHITYAVGYVTRKDGRIIRLISFDYFTASLCIVTHDETRFINTSGCVFFARDSYLFLSLFNMFLSKNKSLSVVKKTSSDCSRDSLISSCSLSNANCFHLNDLIKYIYKGLRWANQIQVQSCFRGEMIVFNQGWFWVKLYYNYDIYFTFTSLFLNK
jgi:hypothetical protein